MTSTRFGVGGRSSLVAHLVARLQQLQHRRGGGDFHLLDAHNTWTLQRILAEIEALLFLFPRPRVLPFQRLRGLLLFFVRLRREE